MQIKNYYCTFNWREYLKSVLNVHCTLYIYLKINILFSQAFSRRDGDRSIGHNENGRTEKNERQHKARMTISWTNKREE